MRETNSANSGGQHVCCMTNIIFKMWKYSNFNIFLFECCSIVLILLLSMIKDETPVLIFDLKFCYFPLWLIWRAFSVSCVWNRPKKKNESKKFYSKFTQGNNIRRVDEWFFSKI